MTYLPMNRLGAQDIVLIPNFEQESMLFENRAW